MAWPFRPKPVDLGGLDSKLRGIHLIEGIGLSSNVYVIGSREPTLVDTGVGDEVNSLVRSLSEMGLEPSQVSQVVLTHSHFDHVGGLRELLEEAEPVILVHVDELPMLRWEYSSRAKAVHDGDVVETELGELTVIHTPGHTAGSICLLDGGREALYSGDTVFADGFFGRCDMPTGSLRMLVESLGRLSELRVEALLPGHGKVVVREGWRHIREAANAAKMMSL